MDWYQDQSPRKTLLTLTCETATMKMAPLGRLYEQMPEPHRSGEEGGLELTSGTAYNGCIIRN